MLKSFLQLFFFLKKTLIKLLMFSHMVSAGHTAYNIIVKPSYHQWVEKVFVFVLFWTRILCNDSPPPLSGNHHHSRAKSTSANDYGVSSIHHPAANLMSWQHQGTQRASIRAPHIQMCSAWAERYPTAVDEHSRNVSVNKSSTCVHQNTFCWIQLKKLRVKLEWALQVKEKLCFLKANTQII